jgi:hypothetical protein
MKSLFSVLFILSTGICSAYASDVRIKDSFDQEILLEGSIPTQGDNTTPQVLETPKFEPVFLDYTLAQRYPRLASGVLLPRHGDSERVLLKFYNFCATLGWVISGGFIIDLIIGQKNVRRLKNIGLYISTIPGIWTLKHIGPLSQLIIGNRSYTRNVINCMVGLLSVQTMELGCVKYMETQNPYLSTSLDPSVA